MDKPGANEDVKRMQEIGLSSAPSSGKPGDPGLVSLQCFYGACSKCTLDQCQCLNCHKKPETPPCPK